MAEVAVPISPRQRIPYLDVLRGLALFGVLTINMFTFAGALVGGPGDRIIQALTNMLIESKFISLFSFLFGLGFAVQMSSAETKGIRLASFYPRRLLALAVFGLIHRLFIWPGDILLNYALLGALTFLFRNQSQQVLLRWAGGIVLTLLLVLTGFDVATALGLRTENEGNLVPATAAAQSGSHPSRNWLQVVGDNWSASVENLLITLPLLSLFLFGLWVWRTGVVKRLAKEQALLKRICSICLPLGLVLNAIATFLPAITPFTRLTDWFTNVLALLFPPVLAAGYAAALAILLQHRTWSKRLQPFAAVGRMALTNYLMQSLVCTSFFLCTGLYGKLGATWCLALTAGLYAGQVFLSNWWLSYFRYGPMEWVWRGLTHGRFPAFLPIGR